MKPVEEGERGRRLEEERQEEDEEEEEGKYMKWWWWLWYSRRKKYKEDVEEVDKEKEDVGSQINNLIEKGKKENGG